MFNKNSIFHVLCGLWQTHQPRLSCRTLNSALANGRMSPAAGEYMLYTGDIPGLALPEKNQS